MATAKSTGAEAGTGPRLTETQLEADVRQLREDIAKLTEQLQATQEHGYKAARRAASESVENLKAQGEAAIDGLRSTANEYEERLAASVREKPMTALAIAAGLGYFFALINRR